MAPFDYGNSESGLPFGNAECERFVSNNLTAASRFGDPAAQGRAPVSSARGVANAVGRPSAAAAGYKRTA